MLAGVGGEWGSVGDLISQSCRSKMRRETSIPHVVLVCTYGVSAVYHSPGSIGQGLTSADPSGLDGILQTDPWVFWRSGLLRLNARPRAMATTNPRLLDCRFPPAQHHPWYQARHIATAISQSASRIAQVALCVEMTYRLKGISTSTRYVEHQSSDMACSSSIQPPVVAKPGNGDRLGSSQGRKDAAKLLASCVSHPTVVSMTSRSLVTSFGGGRRLVFASYQRLVKPGGVVPEIV